jgi:hypothetical protein
MAGGGRRFFKCLHDQHISARRLVALMYWCLIKRSETNFRKNCNFGVDLSFGNIKLNKYQ